jgi:hypothetical protein
MTMKRVHTTTALRAGLVVLGLATLLGAAAPAAGADPWAGVPAAVRPTPGTPNLGGVWQMPRPITVLKTVDGRDPPLLPAARAEYERRIAALKADPHTDPLSNCWLHGVPRLIYAPYPVLITQERDRINFVHEVNHTFRVVTLKKPLPSDPDLDPQWLGYSAGRWEGATLVIDTIGFNDKTWLDYSGLPHSERLRVQERYTLKTADRIEGTVTLTDPLTFSAPWTTAFTLVRKPNYELKESVCVRDHRM